MTPFDTIKKSPIRLSPYRGICVAFGYLKNDAIQAAIASNVRAKSTRTDSLKAFFTRQSLLSMESGANPLRLAPVSVSVSENMQPRKEVPPVYQEVF
jgi:hypothetical protein